MGDDTSRQHSDGCACTMYNGKIIVLDLEGPLRNLAVRTLHLLEPFDGLMIHYYGEASSIEEGKKVIDGLKYNQLISFSDSLFSLSAMRVSL